MNKKDIYNKIQEAIDNLPDNFSILEEQINVELQMQYFNYAKEIKKEFTKEFILERQNDLFDEQISLDEKKSLLVLLATVNEVEAYRTIERFVKNPVPELKDWAILALQESRMLMHSTLLDEQQVYISTGLGGQGKKLRYFAVIQSNDFEKEFSGTQKQLIESELKFAINKHDGLLEEITFEEGFAKILLLMPLKGDIQNLFHSFIDECNQLGNFLNEDVIITNVRKLEISEIKEFLMNGFREEEDFDSDDDVNEDDLDDGDEED